MIVPKNIKMIYLIESKQRENSTDIYEFIRNEDGTKKVKKTTNFKPFFYVPAHEQIKIPYIKLKSGFKTVFGNSVKKIYVKKSSDVPELRKSFKETYESDVLFNNRFGISTLKEEKIVPLKIWYLDIETNSKGKFPDIERANQEIICITIYDTFLKKYITFSYHKKNKPSIEKYDIIYHFKSEQFMLRKFIKVLNRQFPDVLTSWNSKFDFNYLINRLKRIGLEPRDLSLFKSARIDEFSNNPIIKGYIVIDMLEMYKRYRKITNMGESVGFKLNNVAKEILNKSKIELNKSINEIWNENIDKLIEYNIKDVELIKEIDEELDIFNLFFEIKNIAKCELTDTLSSNKTLDCLLLSSYKNLVFPNRRTGTYEEKIKGAFCKEIKPGLYEWVIILDFRALYPSIIRTFNISFDTIDKNGNIKLDNGINFSTKKKGIVIELLEMLTKKRNYYKELLKIETNPKLKKIYERKQYAFKCFQNSIYGLCLFPHSRIYNKQVGESIPFMGQIIIKKTIEFVEKLGFEILSADTDSIFVKIPNVNSLESIKLKGFMLKNKINKYIKKFIFNKYKIKDIFIELEFEKINRYMLFIKNKNETKGAKKKYAYILMWHGSKLIEKPILIMTGFEKSDMSFIQKEIQRKVIEMIFNKNPKEEIIKMLKKYETNIRNGTYKSSEISPYKQITKNFEEYKVINPVIKGAIVSNKYCKTDISKGSKPMWNYISKTPKNIPKQLLISLNKNTNSKVYTIDTITFESEIPEGFKLDYDKICQRAIEDKIKPIFSSLNWKWIELNNKNKTLEMFN